MELNEQRVLDTFLELVKIDTPSYFERPMADHLLQTLRELGLDVIEDEAGNQVLRGVGKETRHLLEHEKQTGNVIATLKGTVQGAPKLLFTAHMDTVVAAPGIQTHNDNGVIRTDGKTILGADDRAGIAALLEAIRFLQESNVEHGDLQFAFTIAEETGLYGSLYLDQQKIHADYAFVMDSGGPPDTIIVASPTEVDFTVLIYGKAAHSGVNPEDGLNAISVAADAISNLKLGRIDEETTINIGVIQGGEKTNIVCDRCEILGEVRSRNDQKLSEQLSKVHSAFQMAGEKWGAKVEVTEQKIYYGFNLSDEDEVVRLAQEGLRRVGIEPKLAPRGGGSDTNNLNAKGIPAVNLGVGANQDHTVEENLRVQDLVDATRLVVGIIQTAAERAGVEAR
ncbi:M20/M25/M40 family metallo-hydrolase [Tumebacillus permanentifrigoris]|uniref:Tripeptide aminopeptidase n=1 Tax=Tumebacillus permanentifrigoris TaxID=378543 RepID=A0A316DDD3_9BACL|nr:M20/M25/M40 family metallo-hydrolase [Tumebacillus permanentifrigoris]PWK14523.1 tripeptide aminopeptidase [Tumebacillus permanentifrigoris]